jgi:hypothetical protein
LFDGYVNRLRTSFDLRALGLDVLQHKNQITPLGEEIKPGVWAGKGVRIHKSARVLAPAYLGDFSQVHAGAVLTRGAVLEHHAAVDCGTVVEASTLLPFACVGAGLDLAHGVVGFKRLHHLRRGALIEVSDSKLIGMMSMSASWRALRETLALATVFPRMVFNGANKKRSNAPDATLPEGARPLAPDLHTAHSTSSGTEFGSNLAVMRRYGNE